jgi:RNA polymerase sigma-70 factor (ECF subfamily)
MEPAELGRLVDKHAAGLALYARQWCAAPEDVVQEGFLKLAQQERPPRNAVAWLYRVVRNLAVSAARAQQRRRRHETELAGRVAPWFLPNEGLGLDIQAATQALQSIPGDEREAILLHLWGGLSFADIAVILDCSTSTAHRRYLYGLERLRERLDVPCPNRPIKS